jgi:hypothetical protein
VKTRIVRINCAPFRVPADELPDPNADRPGGTCRAGEPNGGAVCTLDVHAPDIMHIAHGGNGEVIAMWGSVAVATSADLPD